MRKALHDVLEELNQDELLWMYGVAKVTDHFQFSTCHFGQECSITKFYCCDQRFFRRAGGHREEPSASGCTPSQEVESKPSIPADTGGHWRGVSDDVCICTSPERGARWPARPDVQRRGAQEPIRQRPELEDLALDIWHAKAVAEPPLS